MKFFFNVGVHTNMKLVLTSALSPQPRWPWFVSCNQNWRIYDEPFNRNWGSELLFFVQYNKNKTHLVLLLSTSPFLMVTVAAVAISTANTNIKYMLRSQCIKVIWLVMSYTYKTGQLNHCLNETVVNISVVLASVEKERIKYI